MTTDFGAGLARKWCPVHGTERIEFRRETCSCPRVAAAVREALEEAYQRASVAADLAHALDAIAALRKGQDA